MPGGFARIGRSNDPKAVAMQSGGSVADVWVVSDQPVKAETMLPLPTAPYAQAAPRHPARPRGRQSVLARALCRARRRHDAPVARLFHPAGRSGRRRNSAARLCAHLYRGSRNRSRRSGAGNAALDVPVGDGQRQQGARSLLRRWLDGAERSRRQRRQDRADLDAGRRQRPRHGRLAAQDHRLLRPRARQHVSLHRLAVPEHRPLARAGDGHGVAAGSAGRQGSARRRAGFCRRGGRFRRCRTAGATRCARPGPR